MSKTVALSSLLTPSSKNPVSKTTASAAPGKAAVKGAAKPVPADRHGTPSKDSAATKPARAKTATPTRKAAGKRSAGNEVASAITKSQDTGESASRPARKSRAKKTADAGHDTATSEVSHLSTDAASHDGTEGDTVTQADAPTQPAQDTEATGGVTSETQLAQAVTGQALITVNGGEGSGSGGGNMGERPNEWTDQSQLNIWPHQARQEINAASIQQMADSLLEQGQLNPGHTFTDDSGQEWLITGQRRLLGLRLLIERGLRPHNAPFQIIRLGQLTHAEAMTTSLVENFQRDGLTMKDQVASIDALYNEQRLSPARIASQVGLSETQVRRYISFRVLDDATMAEVDAGTLTSEQAELLARASDHMRQTVRGWIREGRMSLAEIGQMITQQSSTIYMRDALFDHSAYREIAGPKGVTTSLFDGDIATDRTVYMSMQREALDAQIESGQHGECSEHHVILAAEIPADRRLQEDESGTVLVGLVNPSSGQTRVVRCSHRTEAPAANLPLSERERALANVRARMAREVVRGTGLGVRHLASDNILLTLLVQQLGGGERAFALGRHESGELLGLANPALGFEDQMYHSSNTSHVVALLRHCYEGTAQTHRIVLLSSGVREVDGAAFATETGSRDLALLFNGITGQREQLMAQARGLKLNLELEPIRSAASQLREAAQALRAAQVTTPEADALIQVSAALEAGEAVTDGQIQTVWEEWIGTLRDLALSHQPVTLSHTELIARYEAAGDSPEDQAFKAAIEAEDYALANRLAVTLRQLN